jgi:CSLREA domain-containing protein
MSLLRIVSVAILALVVTWAGIAPGRSATLLVTKQADTDDGSCDADCSLREAIDAAGPADTIAFAESGTGILTLVLGQLVIDKAVTITGPGEKLLTISGGDTQRIFDVTPAGSLTAAALTLSHGKGEFYPPLGVEAAGAVLCSGDLAMTDCTFSDNHADGRAVDPYVNDAAVLYSDAVSRTLTFTRCSFLDNSAGGGACIDIDKGRLTITDSLFSGNYGEFGPACVIGNSTDPLTISGSTFVENMARGGGALFLSGSGGATVKDTTFVSNTSMSGYGGGIQVYATTGAVLSNVTMSANVGSVGANLYATGGGSIVVRNSILANTSSNCGGPGTIVSHGYNLDSGTTCAFAAHRRPDGYAREVGALGRERRAERRRWRSSGAARRSTAAIP